MRGHPQSIPLPIVKTEKRVVFGGLTQKMQLNICVAGINTLKPFVFNGIISMLCCNLHNLCCIKICRQRLQHSMFKGFQNKGFSGIKACFFRAKRTFWVNSKISLTLALSRKGRGLLNKPLP